MTHPSLNGHTAYIFPQVQRVANRFGGAAALSVALKRVKRYHPHASVTSMLLDLRLTTAKWARFQLYHPASWSLGTIGPCHSPS